jgi:uncharacterized membrane protein YebE (DUF533 family)
MEQDAKEERAQQQSQASLRAWRQREEIAAQLGISDSSLIDRIAALGLASIRLLPLLPFVRVAWADDHVDEAERDRILDLARRDGLGSHGDAYKQLSMMLRQPPDGHLLDVAEEALAAKAAALPAQAARVFRQDLVRQYQHIAQVRRGFLGFGRGSRAKRAAIARLAVKVGL